MAFPTVWPFIDVFKQRRLRRLTKLWNVVELLYPVSAGFTHEQLASACASEKSSAADALRQVKVPRGRVLSEPAVSSR